MRQATVMTFQTEKSVKANEKRSDKSKLNYGEDLLGRGRCIVGVLIWWFTQKWRWMEDNFPFQLGNFYPKDTWNGTLAYFKLNCEVPWQI